MSERVQVAGLEPSGAEEDTFYVVQIRGIDSEGNPGPWSREFVFQSLQDIPADIDDIIDAELLDVSENDILLYDGTEWVGSGILFDGTFASSQDLSNAVSSVEGQINEVAGDLEDLSDEVDILSGALGDLSGDLQTLDDAVFGQDFYRFEIGAAAFDNNISTIDFDAEPMLVAEINDDATFEAINLRPGKSVKVLIRSTGLNSLTFPNWLFIGSPPPAQIGDEKALLVLHSFGETDEDVTAQVSIAL